VAGLLIRSAVPILAQAAKQRGRPWNVEIFHLIQVSAQD
jgi:hypothetical protein